MKVVNNKEYYNTVKNILITINKYCNIVNADVNHLEDLMKETICIDSKALNEQLFNSINEDYKKTKQNIEDDIAMINREMLNSN